MSATSRHSEHVASIALLHALCSESLGRGDMQSAIGAASAAWSEEFTFAWERLDVERDHFCPRCWGTLTFSTKALQWSCDFCFRQLTNALARRGTA